ncbi:7-deoxyloganetic acid glucosyltransferase, partial [Mucuna pruriens]
MEHSTTPHVLALPFPAEGHIKPMLNLAKLLSHKGHKITFVNTHHNHNRLQQFTDLASFQTQFPDFHFASITDGIPAEHPRNGALMNYFPMLITPSARSLVAKESRELFSRLVDKNGQCHPPSCIIADGIMSTIALGVAQEFGVPLVAFRTYSATCTWVTIHLSKLVHDGALILNNQENLENVSVSIPGLENLLRYDDLPSYFTLLTNLKPDFYIEETLAMTQASGLILNTFEQLESSIITKLATIFPKVYTIGPLHTLIKTMVPTNSSSPHKIGCLRKVDRSCITWLDHQKAKSVLYVSFGTVVKLSHEQLLEFWHGLVNSLKPFLWVIQKDLINGEGGMGNYIPVELELETKQRGLLVDWVPQEEVLAHPAVGGFLTHCGWNSTLECIAEGVPMLCWPSIADQTVNNRCVSEQWRIGLDMNGTCDRLIVEKMVRDIMENQMKELMKSTKEIAEKARDSIKENGYSYDNLENLIEDIRLMK